jgi:hypothetical protein
MTDPLVVPTWWLVVAAFVQAVLLLLNVWFVRLYLQETHKLRLASEKQVAAGQAQVEAQIRPALAARLDPDETVFLFNIGAGPAVHVKMSLGEAGSVHWGAPPVNRRIPFLTVDPINGCETSMRTHQSTGDPAKTPLGGYLLQCEYRSLSGRPYASIVDLAPDRRNETWFHEREVSEPAGNVAPAGRYARPSQEF